MVVTSIIRDRSQRLRRISAKLCTHSLRAIHGYAETKHRRPTWTVHYPSRHRHENSTHAQEQHIAPPIATRIAITSNYTRVRRTATRFLLGISSFIFCRLSTFFNQRYDLLGFSAELLETVHRIRAARQISYGAHPVYQGIIHGWSNLYAAPSATNGGLHRKPSPPLPPSGGPASTGAPVLGLTKDGSSFSSDDAPKPSAAMPMPRRLRFPPAGSRSAPRSAPRTGCIRRRTPGETTDRSHCRQRTPTRPVWQAGRAGTARSPLKSSAGGLSG